MMKTITHKTVLVLLLFGSAVQSDGSDLNANASQGNAAGRNGLHADMRQKDTNADPTSRMVNLCRENGLSDAEIERLLTPVRFALAQSLPVENIVVKIEEGLAKKVDPSLIARAAEVRLNYLRRAGGLLRAVRQGRGGGLDRLTSRVALVLEGGLPDEAVQNTIKHAGRGGPGRLTRVIDMGAELQNAGFDAEQTQLIMTDCLNRNLNGTEIGRVRDFLLKEQAQGRDFRSIYQELWIEAD